ncbi:MAG TPA: chromosome segregation protein SMC [Planctomycetota bacterium]|nr:chromosome segregation protein SMC [Planctomycetota bacterium]
MYLKKLEMLGFKSFADRTEMLFRTRMSAIVGPNGCGKSNVVDAFKWIFGEQSAKGMRGTEMKDVIFNGTLQRKPMGFAEVTIVFENSDRFLDLDYSEVAITRRLYRSGESEYLINKQRCRLKDIRGLFMGTGIGQTSYSILEQGKIDALLQANNVERRAIFEEAAGISKYLARKAETVRALLRVEENLTRLNDIVAEVEKRLQRVKAQASKARRYRELSGRLKDLRVRSAVTDYRESVASREAVSFRLHWCNFRIAQAEGLGAEVSRVLEARVAERRAHAEALHVLRDGLAAERLHRERTSGRIEDARRRLRDLIEEKERKSEDLASTTLLLRQIEERLEGEKRDLEGIAAEKEARRGDLVEQQKDLEVVRGARERIEAGLRAEKSEIVALLQKRSRIGNLAIQVESEVTSLRATIARLRTSIAGFALAAEAERLKEAALKEEVASLRTKVGGLDLARGRLDAAQGAIQACLDALEEDLGGRLAVLHQKRSRHDVLKSLEENLEGISRGAADVLRNRGSHPLLREVHGMAASLVRVDHKFARAVEAAMGVHAQSLVVETQEGAIGLMEFARSEQVGGVHVVSLDRVDSIPREHFPRQAGVLGPLIEWVEVPQELEDLFGRLLANVVLVEDFNTALALSRNGLRPFRLVTLEGEVIEPWGGFSIFGENDLGIISRKSEMADLLVEVSQLEREEEALRLRQAALKRDLTARREEAEALREEAASVSRSVLRAEGNVAQAGRELDRLGREIAVGTSEAAELEAGAEARKLEKDLVDLRGAELDREKAAAEERVKALEAEEAGLAVMHAEISEAVTQVRLGLAQAEKREEGLREIVAREDANIAERRAHVGDLERDIEAVVARRGETEEFLRTAEEDLSNTIEREEAAAKLLESDEARGRKLDLLEQEFRRELEGIHQEATLVGKEREAVQLHDQEERHRRNSIVERIEEEYGLDLVRLLEQEPRPAPVAAGEAAGSDARSSQGYGSEASGPESSGTGASGADGSAPANTEPEDVSYLTEAPGWDREKAREEVREIQEKLRRMGSVNLESLDELDELEERYKFQNAQRKDLVESERNLQGIIAEINRTSREMFLQTFQEVQLHFSDLFRKCFGGGKAELVLEEGVDILEAGVDIVAKPPGKKITSLSLMSGGEKTMTTIALLFAIFRTRPSPFCILDEVDAPLDETNVGRFVVLLQEFLAQTQFLVVTHNKVTMAEASTLYGITMQEQGVSKRVSVELETYDPKALEALAES